MNSVVFKIYLKGKEIRTIEDIRDNFQVYELMELMNSGRLRQWLVTKGYKKCAEELSVWSSTDKKLRKQKLYDVFEVPYDDATAYNITDQLLEEKESYKREFVFQLYPHKEYSNECLQRDLDFIAFEAEHTKHGVMVYLEGGFDSYDIPYEVGNVHYVGYCGDSIYLPRVNLVSSLEKYADNHITFENVNYHIIQPQI